jgi:NAD-dependent DNA ligase
MIKSLEGFDTKTAEYFVDGLDKFILLFNNLTPNLRKQLRQSQLIFEEKIEQRNNATDSVFYNKIFVFSGFRNKEWEKIIESNGGKIGTSISNKTHMLITSEIDNTSSKVLKAKSLNIKILTKNSFENEFFK